MATLIELTDTFARLDSILELHGGDTTHPEVESALTEWEKTTTDLTTKAENYAGLIDFYDRRSKTRSDAAADIKAAASVDKNKSQGLKDRLKLALESLGKKKLEGPRYSITLAKNGGRAPLDIDESRVPQKFYRVELVLDKQAIHDAIAAGEDVPGVTVSERDTHIRIKG